MFYSKFALNNIKKSKKTVIPYILSVIFTIVVFYILASLSFNENLDKLERGRSATKTILGLGNYIIALFAIIFVFYTYSFLIKRRTKEFGLYAVLGMTKKQIAKILILENIYITIITIGLGLILAIILDKLAFLILLKMFGVEVVLGFSISIKAMFYTIVLFSCINIAIVFYTIIKISRLKIRSLLDSTSQGEAEPKAKLLLTICSLTLIIGGYVVAIMKKDPLLSIFTFLGAVVVIIIGTYLLFIAVTITILKILKKNKRIYYSPKNFISISGMLYRMKRNAVGLANISILSTMILVTLGTTGTLYVGSEKITKDRSPRDFTVGVYRNENITQDNIEKVVKMITAENNTGIKDIMSYKELETQAVLGEDKIGILQQLSTTEKNIILKVITLADYNKSNNKNTTLKNNEVLIYGSKEKYSKKQLKLLGNSNVYNVKESLDNFEKEGDVISSIWETYYVVVSDESELEKLSQQIDNKLGYKISYSFNVTDKETIEKVNSGLEKWKEAQKYKGLIFIEEKQEITRELRAFYSSFLFIGIFISAVFVVAQVVIMYYKQISEGYEDKDKFLIMKKVGLEDYQIRKSINSQVLLMFFTPLLVALVHTAVAIVPIKSILLLFGITEYKLILSTMGITFSIFILFYIVVYKITSKIYYRMVR